MPRCDFLPFLDDGVVDSDSEKNFWSFIGFLCCQLNLEDFSILGLKLYQNPKLRSMFWKNFVFNLFLFCDFCIFSCLFFRSDISLFLFR